MSGEAGGGYFYPDSKDEEVAPEVGHLAASDRALVARVTGGRIRSREIRPELEDEESA